MSSSNESNEKGNRGKENCVLDSHTSKTSTKIISLTVPNDAAVGDVLTFVVDGNELEITVPEDSIPGDILQLQVAEQPKQSSTSDSVKISDNTADDCGNGDEDEKTVKVNLSKNMNDGSTNAITLELETQIPERTNTDETIHNNNEKNHVCDGTHAMAWPTGLILAQWIFENHDDFTVKNNDVDSHSRESKNEIIPKLGGIIVELGSGLGTVGLSAAMALSSSSILAQRKHLVIMTDVPAALPLLQKNINKNLEKMSSNKNVRVLADSWFWGQSPPAFSSLQHKDDPKNCQQREKLPSTNAADIEVARKGLKIDWILVSDVLYQTNDSYKSLIQTISTCNHGCSISDENNEFSTNYSLPNVLIGVRWRKPEIERVFFKKLSSLFGYGWKPVDSRVVGKKCHNHCSFDYINEFGTAQMDQYLSQTMISAGGTSISLDELTEENMEKMSDNEYHTLEQQQMQIYIGIPPQNLSDSDISSSNKRQKRD